MGADSAQPRRRLLLAALSAAMAGCTSTPTMRLLTEAVQPDPTEKGAPSFKERVEAIQAPTLMVTLPDSPRAVLVLAEASDHELTWVAAGEQSLVTRKGRIVRTTGLPRNLESTTGADADLMPKIWSYPARAVGVTTFLMNFDSPREIAVAFHAQTRAHGAQTIEILGRHYDTVHIVEIVEVPAWRFTFHNEYWIQAKTGYVWRSRQQFCPEIPPIQLDLVRPPYPALL